MSAETRQMIEDVIGRPLEDIIGRLNVLNANMARIEGNTQRAESNTAKTNGRVDKLEDSVLELQKINLTHVMNCPNNKKIELLQNESVSRKSIVKFVSGVFAVAVAIIGIAIAVAQLMKK